MTNSDLVGDSGGASVVNSGDATASEGGVAISGVVNYEHHEHYYYAAVDTPVDQDVPKLRFRFRRRSRYRALDVPTRGWPQRAWVLVACAMLVTLGLIFASEPLLREWSDGNTQTALPAAPPGVSMTNTPGPTNMIAPSNPVTPGLQSKPYASTAPTGPASRPSAAPPGVPSAPPNKSSGPPAITIDVSSAKYIDVDNEERIAYGDKQNSGDNYDVMIELNQVTSRGSTKLADATDTWDCGSLSGAQIMHPSPGRWCGQTGVQHRNFWLKITEAPGVNMRTITVIFIQPA